MPDSSQEKSALLQQSPALPEGPEAFVDERKGTPALSIVIPVLNDAEPLARLLAMLSRCRSALTGNIEIIVVDGGSSDGSLDVARKGADLVLLSSRGRARQMNAGAAAAAGNMLWFLHADALVSPGLARAVSLRTHGWGRCDVHLAPAGLLLKVVGAMMNLRSRITGICTGDQGIFCSRQLFTRVGEFPDIPLMEDIVLSRRLRNVQRPCCLRERIGVDSRRWQRDGVMRTILLMWALRLAFFLGADPAALWRRYYGARS